MSKTPEGVEESNLRQDLQTAEAVVKRDHWQMEHQARAAAKWLGHDPDTWRDFVDLLIAIDAGRLFAIRTKAKTAEEIESWRNYLANR
jgi:hypothetical protein